MYGVSFNYCEQRLPRQNLTMLKASFGLLVALTLKRGALPVAGFTLQCIGARSAFPAVFAANVGRGDDGANQFGADDDGGERFTLDAFQKAKEQLEVNADEESDEFNGYDFRDIILAKWGKCYDVDFNRVESFGFKKVYLNVFPFYLGRKPFRHATEYDYLCHLQAVVEILQEYGQLKYVLYQIGETSKKPLPGRSPLVAVPCRLDLTEEQVNSILGGKGS